LVVVEVVAVEVAEVEVAVEGVVWEVGLMSLGETREMVWGERIVQARRQDADHAHRPDEMTMPDEPDSNALAAGGGNY
jgi:hypothetical protein